MRARLEINETAPQSVSTLETTMTDYRVYTKANNGRIIAETTVQADNPESAQRKAFRQAKKDGLIPNEKHTAPYGKMGWVANGENQYRRIVVYGDRFKSRAYELHLEIIIETEAVIETETETETEKAISTEKETHNEHRIINEVKESREGTRDAGCGVHPKGDSSGNGAEISHSRAVFQQPRETDCNRRDATPNAQTPSGDRELERSRTATWHDAASDSILARGR